MNRTDFGMVCCRELVLVKRWVSTKMTLFIPTACFAWKMAQKFPKSDKQFNILVTYLSYGLDVTSFADQFLQLDFNSHDASQWCKKTESYRSH